MSTAKMLWALLALSLTALSGCGRLGYDPVTGEIAGDAGAVTGDAGSSLPVTSPPDGAASDGWSPGSPPRRPHGFPNGAGFPNGGGRTRFPPMR